MATAESAAGDGAAHDLRASARSGSVIMQAGRDVITGNVFTGSFARLRDVWIDPGAVFDEVEVDRFAGREWLIERVDRFIERHNRGYVVIQAPAGVGKTMVAAWLAADRGWPCHFTRRQRGRYATTALRNLAAQVIAGYQLSEQFAPGGVLPETAGEPGWFEQVLKAGGTAATARGERLVLIVDGLDEAESFDGELPLGLPTRLPAGVIMVVTCRTGKRLMGMRLPWEHTTFELTDKRNLDDMRLFIRQTATSDPVIAAQLAEREVPEDQFAERLLKRCGGVWVYLRYILNELRLGMRQIDDLENLPSDLIGYYTEALRPDLFDGESARARLTATLAAVTEPLPPDQLARLAGLTDPGLVDRLCSGALRPFLTAVPDTAGVPSYGIYHVSLRDYLHGATAEPRWDADLAEAHRLAGWAREAHARIADLYRRATDENIDGYGLRNLAYHLERAGRAGELHQLLAEEITGTGGGVRNRWYAAHDRAGTLADYLADVQRAYRLAAADNDARLGRGQSVRLGLEVRYSVIAAAVVSLTNSIPPDLITRMVRSGVWTGRQALNHAAHLLWDLHRVVLLASLLPWLPEAERTRAQADAVAVAAATTDPEERAGLYVTLVELLDRDAPHDLLAVAVAAVAEAVEDDGEEISRLRDILPLLPEDLLLRVLALAEPLLDSTYAAGPLLAELMPLLPPAQVRAFTDRLDTEAIQPVDTDLLRALTPLPAATPAERLLTLARRPADPDDRAISLAVVAEGLDDRTRKDVVAEALAAARTTENLEWRASALVWVGTAAGAHQRNGILEEALAVRAGLNPRADPVWDMLDIVELLGDGARQDALSRALRLCEHDPDHRLRARMIETLADATWTEPPFARLLTAAEAITGHAARAEALTALAGSIPLDLSEDLLRAVKQLDAENRTAPLMTLATRPVSGLTAARLLDEAAGWSSSVERYGLVARIAGTIPDRLLGRALTVVQSITDEFGRAMLLARIAGTRPRDRRPPLIAEAEHHINGLLNDVDRARAAVELARVCEPGHAGAVLTSALDAILDAESANIRYYGLKRLLPVLPEGERTRAAQAALDAARADDFTDLRAYALGEIVEWLSPELRDAVLDEAYAAAGEFPYSLVRAFLLADLSTRVPDPVRQRDLFLEATALLDEAASGATVAPALRRIAPIAIRAFRLLPKPLQLRSISAVRMLTGGRTGAGFPREALHLIPDNLLVEAVEAVGAIHDQRARVLFLGPLAAHLPPRPRRIALAHLFRDTNDVRGRQLLLQQAALLWQGELDPERMDVLRRCLEGVDLNDCFALLASVFDLVPAEIRDDLAEQCLDALASAERWWPRLSEAGAES
ncbi:hypothetical protein [Actinoplanes sp. GCM10030250]|uniref:hypothetical protein n=1 Tax=Actinoplanes sp. GCM10030250 TaxID=3273376 RepID=UPI00361A2F59